MRRVIAVDHRNHGSSSGFKATVTMILQDLQDVIAHVGAPCDVMGYLMGGKAAMVLASHIMSGSPVHRRYRASRLRT